MALTADHNATAQRIDLTAFIEDLYRDGEVLEAITQPSRGLSAERLDSLTRSRSQASRLRRLLRQALVAHNSQGRLVLTTTGRELAFDLYGVGAADLHASA